MTDTEPIIRCDGVRRAFTADRKGSAPLEVLKGVDLAVRAGETVAIVGASGSGKSTLLHILGGLDRPSAGSVAWSGRDLARLGDDALAEARGAHVGFVFQFHHLLPEFTALENVVIPQMIRGTAPGAARVRATELLGRVGLAERLHHLPSELSGGEAQRVAVARALANAPRVVLADEPTGNLDSAASAALLSLVGELNRETGQTFIVVTHNEEFAQRSGRVFRMQDGLLLQTA